MHLRTGTKIILSLAALAVLSVLFFLGYQHRLRQDRLTAKETKAVDSRYAALQSQWQTDETRLNNAGLYEKLKSGASVSVLIIGDSIGESDGSTKGNAWSDSLIYRLQNQYHSDIGVTEITENGASVQRNWIEYNHASVQKYDAVFICTGQYDSFLVYITKFQMFYENLIRRIVAANPKVALFPMVESSMTKAETAPYVKTITDLAGHYGLDLIDTRLAFKGKIYKKYVNSDGVHPNDAGYGLYADQIYRLIVHNIETQKSLAHPAADYLYANTHLINDFHYIQKPLSADGFSLLSDTYESGKGGDAISYRFTGKTDNITYVYFNNDTNGGTFNVYVDGTYENTINTKGPYRFGAVRLVGYLPGNHTVKIVQMSKSGSVSINGIVTN